MTRRQSEQQLIMRVYLSRLESDVRIPHGRCGGFWHRRRRPNRGRMCRRAGLGQLGLSSHHQGDTLAYLTASRLSRSPLPGPGMVAAACNVPCLVLVRKSSLYALAVILSLLLGLVWPHL